MKKFVFGIAFKIVAIIAIIVCASSMYIIKPEQSGLLIQFGKVVQEVEAPGIYFKIPFIQSVKKIYTGEQIYDIAQSEVITADKKTMIADAFVTWNVEDALSYHQTLSSMRIAEDRIDVAVYNAMKSHISSTNQSEVISGKDGSSAAAILSKVEGMDSYGLDISNVEMKLLDLPSSNKSAVYGRMISEREAIAAQHTAEGQQIAKNTRSRVDKEARIILSNAQTEAAKIEAAGDEEYFKILAEAYNKDEGAREFYQFMIGLNALKSSLTNGGTFVIDASSPLYDVIQNTGE